MAGSAQWTGTAFPGKAQVKSHSVMSLNLSEPQLSYL